MDTAQPRSFATKPDIGRSSSDKTANSARRIVSQWVTASTGGMPCPKLRWSNLRFRYAVFREGLAEMLGTAVLILLGDGVGAQTRLGNKGGNEVGLLQKSHR